MTSAALDRVFAALSSPARRKMLDILQQRPGITIAELAKRFRMSPVGVLKHVKLLERASLLTTVRKGRVRLLYFNAVPIQQIYDRWTDTYTSFWAGRMLDMKERLEAVGGQRGSSPSNSGFSPGDDSPIASQTVVSPPNPQRSLRSA